MNYPETQYIAVRIDARVAYVRLLRPKKRNAIHLGMLDELAALCDFLDNNQQIHLLIISGEQESFSAGGDVHEWGQMSNTEFVHQWVNKGHTTFDAVARLSQPVIAVLNGNTLGGGLELAVCCDYRIAEKHIRIGQPESSIGIIPGWSGTKRAVRRCGAQAIRRMALFGEILTAQQALALGLVDVVVDEGKGMTTAQTMADTLLQRGPHATRITKLMINAAEGEQPERAMDSMASLAIAAGDELQEGLAAFREKRTPNFGNLD